MTERQYLRLLKKNLRGLLAEDKKTILESCREHFREGSVSGLREDEIAQSLGTPEEMAAESVKELGYNENWNTTTVAAKVVQFSFSGLVLLFFNLVFVLGPYMALVSVLFALWVTTICLIFIGIAISVGIFFVPFVAPFFVPYMANINSVTEYMFMFFGGMTILSFGGLLAIGMFYVSRGFAKLTVKYVRMNIRIIGN